MAKRKRKVTTKRKTKAKVKAQAKRIGRVIEDVDMSGDSDERYKEEAAARFRELGEKAADMRDDAVLDALMGDAEIIPARHFWEKGKPLPTRWLRGRNEYVPCPACLRVTLNNGGHIATCLQVHEDVAFFRCRNCGNQWQLQVAELGANGWAFPTRSRCPKCGSLETRATNTKGDTQYRQCQVAACGKKYSVKGKRI